MNQFGGQKGSMGGGVSCQKCEAMLQDALDGALNAAERSTFDLHLAGCPECSKMMADAQRGVAWLEMLKPHRPEPPATMVERILAQTTGSALTFEANALQPAIAGAAMQPPAIGPLHRIFSAGFGQSFRNLAVTLMQPRLAMTTAMAFFSIALTMNLTGVRLSDLKAADLRPSNIKRTFYETNAHVARYYDNLRVVYELESKVRQYQKTTDEAPAKQAPADDQKKDKDAPKPDSGTSRRQVIGGYTQLALSAPKFAPLQQRYVLALPTPQRRKTEGRMA